MLPCAVRPANPLCGARSSRLPGEDDNARRPGRRLGLGARRRAKRERGALRSPWRHPGSDRAGSSCACSAAAGSCASRHGRPPLQVRWNLPLWSLLRDDRGLSLQAQAYGREVARPVLCWQAMNGFVRRLAARLLEEDHAGARDRMTRNRHFDAFGDAEGRLALRIYRHLRSLRRDILSTAPGPVSVERGFGGDVGRVRLSIALAGKRGTRTAFLSPEELDLLLEIPGIRSRLAD
jgi:hypothetical protein